MQVQNVTHQPNFKGKIVFEKGTTADLTHYISDPLWRKFREVANLVSSKPYDLFISRNKQNANFYNIAANKSYEEAQAIKEYTVKVQKNAVFNSIVDAAKDAMEMYENYISKNIKG